MKILKVVRAAFSSVALVMSLMLGIMEASLAEESVPSDLEQVSEFTFNSVNINTAEAEVIAELITGVGPQKAQAIVNYREKFGEFKSIEDLLSVKGIGPGILEKNSQAIRFN